MSGLRNKFLAGRKKIGSVVERLDVIVNGVETPVTICRPGLSARTKCMKLFETDGGVRDFSKMQAIAVIACLRDATEDPQPIFDDTDLAELSEETACGDWFDRIAPKCVELIMPSSEGNLESSD